MSEAEIEHDSIKQLIERVQTGEVDEVQLTAMIKVMNEYVNHHVNEEQRKMFPRVRRAELDLEAIGRELLERKTELEAELQDAMSTSRTSLMNPPDPAGRRAGLAAAWLRATTSWMIRRT